MWLIFAVIVSGLGQAGGVAAGGSPKTEPSNTPPIPASAHGGAGVAAPAMKPTTIGVQTGIGLITLELAKAEMSEALRMIASQGGINLIIGPEVTGAVSVSLNNVPVKDALRAIAAGNSLALTENGSIFTITRPGKSEEIFPDMKTRIFRPRSVAATDLRWALEPALSQSRDKQGRRLASITVLNEDSKAGYGIATLMDSNSSTGGSSTTSAGSSGGTTSTGTGNSTQSAINSLVSGGGEGAGLGVTTTDDRTANVQSSQVMIITDTEAKLNELSRLIDDLDRPQRQVLVEARIVEMTLRLQKQLGIDWNIEVFANGPLTQHDFPLNHNSLEFAHTTGGDSRPSLGTVDFTRFTAVLQANQDDGGARLLANPRLLVFNNHRAGILVGERYPILRTSITDQGTATESFETYIPIGVQLSVTPTILADNRVSMLVHPATTRLGDDVVGTTGLRVARINTRELDTRVIMRDGQTIVLGGLIGDVRDNTIRKIPGLGDVPVLNWVARFERRLEERTDLLIFLTIRVEGSDRIDDRDQEIYDTYRPHFKRITGMKDAKLDFELPGFEQEGGAHDGKEPRDDQYDPRERESPTPFSTPGQSGEK